MYQKTKSTHRLKRWTLAALSVAIVFSSCQKDLSNQSIEPAPLSVQKIQLPKTTNPYSLRNVHKAQQTIAQTSNLKTSNLLMELLIFQSMFTLSLAQMSLLKTNF
jgi:hypothetical protein